MLPRHRRRLTMIGGNERRRPQMVARVLIAVVVLIVMWYIAAKVFSMFDYSVGKRTAAMLNVRSGGDNVQVSLQGGEWQHAESNLKLYAGDAVALRGSADVLLQFFDGTRVRLDQSTDVLLEKSDRYDQSNSSVGLKVRSGRVWIATPSAAAYSGAIVRTVTTENFSVTVPSSAQAHIASHNVLVLRADGLGLNVDLSILRKGVFVMVGEGQNFQLTNEAVTTIKEGRDPYDVRDPITPAMIKDEFIATSYALLSQESPVITGSGAAAVPTTQDDLSVTSPENNSHATSKTVTVSGRVSDRVRIVLVNGQNVPVRKDLSFSVDMSLGKETTANLRIEAQDAQGITLDSADLSVINDYQPVVEPVRIKSPVGSGQTLETNQNEIEITGEAPAKTASVVLNEYKLQLYKPGDKTWSYLASTALGNLVPGTNVYTVYAVDSDGNKSPPRSITINLSSTPSPTTNTGTTASSQPPLKQNPPLEPGSLSVQQPVEGASAETSDNELSIIGKTSADTASISVNGYTLSLYTSRSVSWKYIASTNLQTMKRGKNVYRIVARNAGGEILDVLEYTITYNP